LPQDYDATARTLLERHPGDWLALFGLDRGLPVRVIESNLSVVTAEADKVLRLDGPRPAIVHVEVQKDHDKTIPQRLLRYHSLLRVRHGLPVLSGVVLLTREADSPALTGVYEDEWLDGRPVVRFQYPVVRVWELPAAALAAAPGTLPLAALAARTSEELERVAVPALAAFHHPPTTEEREVRASLFLLAGLRFDEDTISRIIRGEGWMTIKDSVTYQAIMREGREEGRIEGERSTLIRLASRRFGPPDDSTRGRVEAVVDRPRLEDLLDRVLTAASWKDLLADTA